jgi:hypothetical protein
LSIFDPSYPTYVLYKDYFENAKVDQECAKKCPLECNKVKYHVYSRQVSYTELNGKNDSLKLRIYYEDLNYLNYEETPTMNDYSLVSNMGGVIGLLLGIFFF